MIKHGYNQQVKSNFRAKFGAQIDTEKSFQDKGKYVQVDSNQSVKCFYLCPELKMVNDSVCHLYSDRLFC